MRAADFLVVGGGLVGAAIGYGLAKRGVRVTLIDEGDTALRAARGNFGNVWVQGKGIGRPHYAAETRAAALAWPALAAELADRSATSRDGVWIAAPSPEITARAIVADLGRVDAVGAAEPLPPAPGVPAPVGELRLDDDALVCRCESVTVGGIVRALEEGCAGPNQVKAFTRCGMGACQGRACGAGLTEIIAARTGRRPAEIGYFRIRMPLRPVALGAIADSDA
jgi:glycine/D-amino acid oxidase-like deaminating enzyme